MKSITINFPVLILSVIIAAVLFCAGLYLLEIDTDITGYLPQNDSVISDAEYIFENHPIQDRLVIDIGYEKDDPDTLVECAELVEQKLRDSGLFKQVGMRDFQDLMPNLISHILNNLPVLFTERDLDEKVKPLLQSDKIHKRLGEIRSQLLDLEGIGQSQSISRDPLGLRNMVLARLSNLAPFQKLEIYKGNLISSDRKHLLLVTIPTLPGTDTAFGRRLMKLFDSITDEITGRYSEKGGNITITPVGAFRAALDNEIIAKRDVEKAILLVTIGIALLLVFAFPRPLLGLFAFLPAIAGTATAFFVFSLLNKSISIMALGFGGAIISITVDHAIAYLLFLDRPCRTFGKEVSREIRAVGLVAALTTIGAFGALWLSDFPIFQQIGQFTALGIAFSFLFVHSVFPRMFPSMPPASPRALLLRRVVDKFSSMGKKGAYAALFFAVGMFFFAKPEFNVNLSSMNTVSKSTAAAEKRLTDVWGKDIFHKTYLMTEGKSVKELQERGDRLLKMIDRDLALGAISSGFVPSMVFPGEERGGGNFNAWRAFWDSNRIEEFKKTLREASSAEGFAADAFEPFYKAVSKISYQPGMTVIPDKFLDFMGITQLSDGTKWVQFSGLTPGESYDAERFHEKYRSSGRIFDPALFSVRMGELLFSTFTKMLFLVGLSVIILLFFFFLDWKLIIIALLPVLFALVSTLGTLKLIGHPLDIPGLMLSIVVIGMGIDYSLFLVRSYQRYPDESHPGFALIRMTVFMASASTIIGFGVLCFAEHSLLKSAGLTSLLGIGYALTGAFLILPPVLKTMFQAEEEDVKGPGKDRDRILRRYRKMEPYPRLFARFKLMLDPMFSEMPRFLDASQPIKTIIDIGIGYGVPACWLLERFQEARVYGIDPDPERVRVASRAVGGRGVVASGCAPDVPMVPESADTAIMLDMIHFLEDEALNLTLKRLQEKLRHGGHLIVRAVIPAPKNGSWKRRLETLRHKVSRTTVHYRSVEEIKRLIIQAGFKNEFTGLSGSNQEWVWFISTTT